MLRLLPLAFCITLAYNPFHPAYAQTAPLQADPNAAAHNRPVIDSTANDRALVQIVAPNAAGVSHNQYQHFNVGPDGVILNNATRNTLTQQGGWVGANPHLGNGPAASLILNEVTGFSQSQLRGYLEVAGQRAEVVVSNPNGIMVDGFGFINASRGTLTTGTPMMGPNGALDALRVTRGEISIDGRGFNDTATAQVDLIARSVKLNADLWADRLNVITGANRVGYNDGSTQVISGDGEQPTVAIDVAALGGMYANRIRLVGTEAGVGVTSYGKMASAGEFEIDSAGRITLAGDTSAGGNMRVSSTDGISNQGAMTSGGSMHLRANDIDNRGGSIATGGNLGVEAGALNNTGGGIRSNRNASIGVRSDYTHAQGDTLTAVGDLAIDSSGTVDNQNELTAGGTLSVRAANIVNRKDGLINGGATVLQAEQAVTNTGRIFGDDIAIGAQTLTNDKEGSPDDNTPAGVIAARNTLDIGAQTIVNREHALMKSEGDMRIGGALDADNKATGTAADITNSSATIDSGGKLAIASERLLNTNAHFASEIQLDPGKTRSWIEYEIDGSPRVYTSNEAFINNEDDIDKLVIHATGGRYNDYTIRHLTETTRRTVVTKTDPGKILSRGDMAFSGGTVVNDKSAFVAGGALTGAIEGVDNGGTNPQGEIFVHRTGTSQHHSTKRDWKCKRDDNWGPRVPIGINLPVTHFDLGIWTTQAHTQPDGAANPATGQVPHIAVLPDNQLYRPSTVPNAPYAIETDPAFTNYRRFLSSDYQLSRFALDPQRAQKRLGDGYYEQQLVHDQLLRLTGSKSSGGTASNEDQYRALMDAGITFAQQFQLTPGIALSPAQMAQLTSDIVWLVEQPLTLADGRIENVLAPVVYLSRLRAQDVKPTGALIAADVIDLKVNGSLTNAGTLQANRKLAIDANQDINNSGTLASSSTNGVIELTTGRDLNNRSGNISGNRVAILTGRDANIATATNTSSGDTGTQIALDRTGSITANELNLHARRDINLDAAVVTTTGDANLSAERNLNLNAVTTQEELKVTYDDKNHLFKKQERANGTTVQTGGNANFIAGNDLTSRAAYVNSAQALTATAGNNLDIGAVQQANSYDQEVYVASSGMLSSQKVHSRDRQNGTQSVGSTFSGDSVAAQAGKNLNVIGSNVVAAREITGRAGGEINIVASQDEAHRDYERTETRSGLMVTDNKLVAGKQKKGLEQTEHSVTNNLSVIGSQSGSVNLQADGDANLAGAQLQAHQNIDVSGRNVNIAALVDTLDTRSLSYTETSGIRVGAKSNVTDAAMALRAATSRGQDVSDPRLKALYAAKAAYAARDLAQVVEQARKSQSGTGGLSGRVSIGIGVTREERLTETHVDTVQKSQAAAGGQLKLTARGDATPDQGDLRIKGSTLKGDEIALNARRDLVTESQQAVSKMEDTYRRIDAEVGLYAGGKASGNGGAKGGAGVYGAIDYRQSKTEITNVTHVETTVDATKKLDVNTGRDASLTGTVVNTDQIKADIGRNLTLTSEQDTDRYRQQSFGGQLEGRYAFGNDSGVSGSVNYSQTKSDYKSVQEQTGLNAGKGGFDIKVGNHTQLNGAVISSQAEASKNKLSTDTLGHRDINNEAGYKAISFNASFGSDGGSAGGVPNLNPLDSLVPGLSAPVGDSKSSTTKSAIAQGNIEVRQDQQTGSDSTSNLSRDTANTNQKLDRIFDAQKVSEQQEMGRVLGEVGNRAIGDVSQKLGFKDGSPEKMALHAMLGALQAKAGGGNVMAAAAATAGTEWMGTAVQEYLSQKTDLSDSQRKSIQQWAATMTGAAIGGVVGGNGNAALAGGSAALDAERFNRQLHEDETARLLRMQRGKSPEEQRRLADAACAMTRCAAGLSDINPEKAAALASQQRGEQYLTEQTQLRQTGLFDYSGSDRILDARARTLDRVGEELASAGRGAINLGREASNLLRHIALNGPNAVPQDLPHDPFDGDSNTPSGSAGAVVTPAIPLCVPPVCMVAPSIVVPTNVYVSTGSRNKGEGPGREDVDSRTGASDSLGQENLASPERTQHILNGDASGGGHLWPGAPGKSVFPKDWSASKVMNAISDIATNPSIAERIQASGRVVKEGSIDGVNIRVVMEPSSKGGGIVTAFPTNRPRNPK